MQSTNGYLAVTPFKEKGLEAKTNHGFATIKQKTSLTELGIVFRSDKFGGGKVWVNSQVQFNPYAKELYTIGDITFILIPESDVRLYELEVTASRVPPTPMPGIPTGEFSTNPRYHPWG